jgi:hypothetical protein
MKDHMIDLWYDSLIYIISKFGINLFQNF